MNPPKETPGRPKFRCPPRGAGWAQPGPGGAQFTRKFLNCQGSMASMSSSNG